MRTWFSLIILLLISTTVFASPSSFVNSNPTASKATALAANGANCSAGSFPLGVDASGAAETCTTPLSHLAFSTVTGANTACNTTCGSATCIFGEDTSVIGTTVACTDATADVCVCVTTA